MHKSIINILNKSAIIKNAVKAKNFVPSAVETSYKLQINRLHSTVYLATKNIHMSSPKIDVPVVWIIGGPGSGKGTQCDKIVDKYGFTHLSSGDLLRNEVASGSLRGKELTEIMERGALVPLDIVLELIRNAMINKLSTSKGFLIDGYPREKAQGIRFEEIVSPVSAIVFFDCNQETLVKRLLNRAQTSGRVDDNEETIMKRLETFLSHTDPILNHYTEKIKRIDAERTVDDIFNELVGIFDSIVVAK